MSQFQKLQDGTILPDIETLTGDAGGAVGPDGAFNIDTLGGIGLTVTGNPGANSLTMEVDAQENIVYVAKHGADANSGLNIENAKLTIQSAITAADAGDTILVSPGTYTETITHDANNVTLKAEGKPNTCIITQADANVINFAGFTGLQYKGFRIQCTAATTAIWTIEGTTGECTFKDCHLRMTSAADLAQVAQPGVARVTGAGTIRVVRGRVFYYHTGNGGGTAQKAAFSVANGSFIHLGRIEEIEIINSGTALVSAIGVDLATTGIFEMHDCQVSVDDVTATNVVGLAYVGGTGTDHEYFRNNVHVTGNGNCYGFFADDTATSSRFFYNHIHVEANTAYSFHIGNTSTVISQLDDIIAANGVQIPGTGIFTCASSLIDGDLTCRSSKAADVEQITIMNTNNTATASRAALNISVGGDTSTGDPYVNFLITGGTTYSFGIDNSDADNIKLTTGATPSAGTELIEIEADATDANLNIQAILQSFDTSGAGDVSYSIANLDNTAAASNAALNLSVGGTTSTGDPYINFLVTGAGTYSVGIDNTVAGDPFKITTGATPSAGTDLFTMTNAGVITLNNDLDVTEGGTGVSAFTIHGILLGNAAGDIQVTAEPSDGQLLIGDTGGFPVLATLASADASVTITNGAGTIDLAAATGFDWNESTGATQAAAVDNGYVTNRGGGVTVTLPDTAAFGSVVRIAGKLGTWVVAQNAGETIHFGNQDTTVGAGGSLTSTDDSDCVELLCTTANTDWTVLSSVGNITVT